MTPLNQIRLTNVAYVRLKKNNQIYEVAAYRNKVVNWRNKIETDLNEVLQVQDVFTNVARGLVASNNDLLRGFDTTDKEAICKEILEKGEFQVSELERKSLLEGMFRDVASIVVDKSYNTDTGRPYSMSMIQNAMKDIHYSVNLSKGAKQQALDVIRRLKKVMPIARTRLYLRITTPVIHVDELEVMLKANAADILKKNSSLPSSSPEKANSSQNGLIVAQAIIEASISPENFRVIQDLTSSITNGKGILEIVHQQQALVHSSVSNVIDKDDIKENLHIELEPEENKKEYSTGKAADYGDSNKKNENLDDVFFMAKSSKGNNKKKKKEKRLAKQQKQALEEDDNEGNSNSRDEESLGSSDVQAVLNKLEESRLGKDDLKEDGDNKAPKKSKKNKRMDKEKKKEFDRAELIRAERLESLETEKLACNNTSDDKQKKMGSFKCNTCSAFFPESAQHRAHFKSDWHRINLKRKLQKLPLVSSEEEFYSVPMSHWECNIDDHV